MKTSSNVYPILVLFILIPNNTVSCYIDNKYLTNDLIKLILTKLIKQNDQNILCENLEDFFRCGQVNKKFKKIVDELAENFSIEEKKLIDIGLQSLIGANKNEKFQNKQYLAIKNDFIFWCKKFYIDKRSAMHACKLSFFSNSYSRSPQCLLCYKIINL